MYTLDANIFTRTLHASQPQYNECDELITYLSLLSIPIIVPVIILAETAAAVRRETGDAMRARLFAEHISGLPSIQFVAVDKALADQAANIASDAALRGMDAIYVAVAQRHKCILVTLDGEVRSRAARIVSALSASEALNFLKQNKPTS